MSKLSENPALRRLLYCFAGLVLGVVAALLLTSVVLFLFPLISGRGSDPMTRGIMGTMLMVFSAPLLGLTGLGIAYSKSIKKSDGDEQDRET